MVKREFKDCNCQEKVLNCLFLHCQKPAGKTPKSTPSRKPPPSSLSSLSSPKPAKSSSKQAASASKSSIKHHSPIKRHKLLPPSASSSTNSVVKKTPKRTSFVDDHGRPLPLDSGYHSKNRFPLASPRHSSAGRSSSGPRTPAQKEALLARLLEEAENEAKEEAIAARQSVDRRHEANTRVHDEIIRQQDENRRQQDEILRQQEEQDHEHKEAVANELEQSKSALKAKKKRIMADFKADDDYKVKKKPQFWRLCRRRRIQRCRRRCKRRRRQCKRGNEGETPGDRERC